MSRLALAFVLVLLGACTGPSNVGPTDASFPGWTEGGLDAWPPPPPVDAWVMPRADTGPLDDAQVLAVIRAANEHIIALAESASTHAGRPSVQAFAQQIVATHQMAESRLDAVASGAGLTPVESNASADITAMIPTDVAWLESQHGIDVDLAFLSRLQALLGMYSALASGTLSSATTLAALATELTDEAQLFLDEYGMCDVVRGGSPEAGLDYDAGPSVDASIDVGNDA